ncbi:MAG: toxin-antitoxin system YwqK family antitoxin [Flavobacteriaceae bacterium]
MRLTKFIFLFFLFVFGSCNLQTTKSKFVVSAKKINNISIVKEQVILDPLKGQWFYKDKPFNGFAVAYFENEKLSEKIGFFNGRREGSFFKYFKDGSIKSEGYYINNMLHGVKRNYFKNGNLFSESNYVNGKRDGLQKTWFIDGQLAKKKNLHKGKEKGLQQAWLKNGKLYINYEAKNGRVFGLKRANLCYTLQNEKIVQK